MSTMSSSPKKHQTTIWIDPPDFNICQLDCRGSVVYYVKRISSEKERGAATDRAPVLALLGQVPEVFLGSESLQEIAEVDIFKSFCVYAEMIASPGQALDSPLPSLVEILIDSDLFIQAVHRV